MRMPRVLLLNPPARRPVLRDYYCSTLPKAGYFWQPIDLLALGALLRGRADVRLNDACGERRSARRTEADVESFAPDTVFALVSTLTRDHDFAWLRRVAASGARVVIGGEVALDPRFDFDAHPGIAGLVLDFTASESADFLLGGPPRGRVRTREHEPAAPATNAAPSSVAAREGSAASGSTAARVARSSASHSCATRTRSSGRAVRTLSR